jgi:hypothetical protein
MRLAADLGTKVHPVRAWVFRGIIRQHIARIANPTKARVNADMPN